MTDSACRLFDQAGIVLLVRSRDQVVYTVLLAFKRC